MPNLKDIKRRMGSVKKTRQITSAMKLVSGAKLRRATEAAMSARPYKEKMQGVLARVASTAGSDASSPLLRTSASTGKVLLVIVTSDRGLCGAFNSSLLRRTEDFIAKQKKESNLDCDLLVYGRKGRDFLTARKYAMVDAVIDYTKRDKMSVVREVSDTVVNDFMNGVYERIYLVSNEFVNVMIQTPQFQQILPLSVDAQDDEDDSLEYQYEPGPNDILDSLLPLFLRTLLLQGFLETEAGEHAARMTAMDNATRNASDLLDELTLDYNRARQAAITNEIIEIVSGAEAL
jgi:F-type H+-transporting ATPase subunit gamma